MKPSRNLAARITDSNDTNSETKGTNWTTRLPTPATCAVGGLAGNTVRYRGSMT
jgi:hypothetical protein